MASRTGAALLLVWPAWPVVRSCLRALLPGRRGRAAARLPQRIQLPVKAVCCWLAEQGRATLSAHVPALGCCCQYEARLPQLVPSASPLAAFICSMDYGDGSDAYDLLKANFDAAYK